MKTRINQYVVCGLLVLILGILETAATDVIQLQGTIVDSNGLNFAEGRATRFSTERQRSNLPKTAIGNAFKGYQYATYYDDNRNVCLGRRKLPDGDWEILRFTDYAMPGSDSHNVVTLGICAKDGTIHFAFDHHADPLNYRVSTQNAASDPESVEWSTDLFGPVMDELGSVGSFPRFTYPYFFNAPNGNLMLYFREGGSGNGIGMIQEYDGTTHDWTTGLGKFIEGTGTYTGVLSTNSRSRNAYLNAIAYAGNRIHVSWVWRESAGGSQFNHDLCYAYSDDDGRTWHNNEGTVIGRTGASSITVDSPKLVVAEIPQNVGLSNQYTHYAYEDGSCHVMLTHNLEGSSSRRYHHYWRDTEGNWSKAPLSFNGSRPKIVGDEDRNLFMVYASGGRLRIAKGIPNAEKTEWTWTSVYTQPGTTEAGEGLIDYTRWEQDGVLSVYGQERPSRVLSYGSGTPINGLPSPVHVFDYQVSPKAILPVPTPKRDGASLDMELQWTAGIAALSHNVYLGTDLESVAMATPKSPEFRGQQPGTIYTPPSNLKGLTDYYWRIDEVQRGGAIIRGQVWKFTTSDEDPTINPVAFGLHGEHLEFTYLRRSAEVAAGVTYKVEMTDTLQEGSWTSEGISQEIQNDSGSIQMVKATLPQPSAGKRFVKLTIFR